MYFGLHLVLFYIIAPPGQVSCPRLQGSYVKLPNKSATLARCYSTYCQHCILEHKTVEDVGESAKKEQKENFPFFLNIFELILAQIDINKVKTSTLKFLYITPCTARNVPTATRCK